MLSYLLSTLLLLAVSFGDNDCNSIVYTSSGITFASPTNKCQITFEKSYKYVCNGTEINQIDYDSIDCNGNITSTLNNICHDNCTAICDKSDCNGIYIISYNNSDCNSDDDDDILTKMNYSSGYCNVGSKYTCNNGQIEYNTYTGSGDYSNNPESSFDFDTGVCIKTDQGTSIEHDGCDYDSSRTTFKLFGAVVIVFNTFVYV